MMSLLSAKRHADHALRARVARIPSARQLRLLRPARTAMETRLRTRAESAGGRVAHTFALFGHAFCECVGDRNFTDERSRARDVRN